MIKFDSSNKVYNLDESVIDWTNVDYMRNFDYSKLLNYKWDTETVNLLAHENDEINI